MLEAKPYLRSVQIKANMQVDWSIYPFAIPAVNDIEHLTFHPDVTFLWVKMVLVSRLLWKPSLWHLAFQKKAAL